jgi:ligand-binding SRPBCC domain-containing protein
MEFVLERRTTIARELDGVFQFFADAENLERITPPALGFRIRSELPIVMRKGATIEYTIRLYGIPLRWRTLISEWNPPHSFEDTQTSGPYRKWVHTHTFERDGAHTVISDRVVYALPFGILGRIVQPLVSRQLERIFDYRTSVIAGIFNEPG